MEKIISWCYTGRLTAQDSKLRGVLEVTREFLTITATLYNNDNFKEIIIGHLFLFAPGLRQASQGLLRCTTNHWHIWLLNIGVHHINTLNLDNTCFDDNVYCQPRSKLAKTSRQIRYSLELVLQSMTHWKLHHLV